MTKPFLKQASGQRTSGPITPASSAVGLSLNLNLELPFEDSHDVGLFMQRTCDSKTTPEESPSGSTTALNPSISCRYLYMGHVLELCRVRHAAKKCLMPILVFM
jgi:hypothetical protein